MIQKENQMSDKESNESGQSKHNLKLFLCRICNEEYFISFYLNQHIRNVHEKQKLCSLAQRQPTSIIKLPEYNLYGFDGIIEGSFIISQ